MRSSSEAEPCSRGRSALDRDGSSLEEASSPRARRNPARGGAQPLSEAEPHPRGRPTFERGGALPAWHQPLERSGAPPEGGWADCLVGRGPVGLAYARFQVHLSSFL
jgi:hypothetical protein